MFRPKSTLEQWRIFQAVVEQGGYAQAAEKLNKVSRHSIMPLLNYNRHLALHFWRLEVVKPI